MFSAILCISSYYSKFNFLKQDLGFNYWFISLLNIFFNTDGMDELSDESDKLSF